ncbi:MAG: hypothetical protein ACLFVL_02125 [Candidatus Aenigmatarchaeota archaeon]
MTTMKSKQIRTGIKNNWVSGVIIFFVALILILPVVSLSFTASADDGGDVELPEWYKGDMWRYEMREELAQNITYLTEVRKEVTDERGEVTIDNVVEDGEDTYKSYVVSEKHNREYEEDDEEIGEVEGEFHYTRDHLSPLLTHPEGAARSFYYPPIVEMDFPLTVGKNWSSDEGWFFEDTNPEEDEAIEPSRKILEYYGEVERRVTKEVDAGIFDAVVVNLTILGEDLDKDVNPLELKRFEIFYAPEVKNIIHRNIYETRRVPEDVGAGDNVTMEEQTGTETLVNYELQEGPSQTNGNDNVTPFLGVGPILFAVLGTALIYHYKKYGKMKGR